MSMRPFTDNRGGLNHLVDAQIGRAFPVVHKVYQHLDAIEYVAQVYESGRARDIVIRTNHTKEWIEWQYKGEAKWTILFKFSDLLGADIADVVAAEQAIAAELKQLRQQLAADAKTVIEARAAATEARLGAEAARDAASESQAAAAQSVVTATQLAQNLGDATAAAEASAAAAQADREAAQAAQAVVTSSAQEASTAAVAANAARDSAQGSATEASAAKDVTSLLQAAAEQSALAAAQSQTAAGDFADAASASATAAALSESTAASHLADLTIAAATTEAAAAAGAQHLSAIESQVVAAGLLKEQTETASQAAVDAQAAAEVAANAAEAAVATVTAGVAEVAASTTTATEAATQASNARDTAVSSAVTATEQAATATASRAAAELAAATASAAQLSSGNFLTEVEQFRDLTQVLRNEAETFRDESLTYRNQAEQMQIDAQVVAADRQRAEDAADSIAAAKSKLDGIAPGATANQTDVFLLNRVNHTGEQPISTVAGLQDSLDSKQNTLISGTSLKTINGVSILGGGDIVITNGDELAVPRLNSLLVYYGYPIAYKGIWNVDAIVAEISVSHDYWVVGHTYQDPAHEEYASTVAIMRGVRAAGVKLYGYIPLGTNSYNYTVAQIEAITDQWMAAGVDGIFIDEYGFDYGNTRQRQVDVVNMIHTKGLPICANAWVMEEFVTDSLAETGWPSGDWRYVSWQEWNPTNIPSPAQPGDSYLLENFCYDHLGPTTIWGAQERAERARALALQNDVSVWGMAVFAETTPGTLDTAKLGNLATLPAAGEYISANAFLYDINVVGSGGFSFGSNGTPLWAPLRQLPEGAQLPASPAGNNYTDKTGTRYFGSVKLTVTNTDTTQGVEVVSAIPSPLGDVPKAPLVHTHAIADMTGLQAALDAKQNTLVSGTSIKTINGESLLGAGNIDIVGAKPSLQGDTTPYVTQTKTYQITNYNSFSSYTVSASAGTASLSGDTITFTAPSSAGNVSLTLTVDGQPTAFVIAVQAAPTYIPTPTPTPANFGDPLEGGFYAGMVWGQIAQSSTSAAIGTGSKTFTVPSMTAAPIVYSGQTVEVRSRANPANKFVGTVTGAAGTNLTINVTSIGGSGTFSDWSVMARHRVIVAPKASGEHAGIALKNANTALPTACQTLAEGFAATQAMRDADTSTVYPAAHWVRNLAIGGRTDWYIPARDELELCWRNLKPTTATNYVDANRPAAASFSYANNGSYGDTTNTHGTNNNSSPTGAAYTASVPGQTAATAFRTGGAEAYESGSAFYWSSSDYNASVAYLQYWHSSFPGAQDGNGKTVTFRVRAVRRSII